MTSTPARNGTRGPMLASIYNQTIRPDQIFAYSPPGVEIFADLQKLGPDDYGSFIEQRCATDLGPVMKISAVVMEDLPADSIVITVDDDIIYERCWLEKMLEAAHHYPGCAVGFSGWNAHDLVKGGDYRFAHGSIDVLEGWAGAAYRPRFFDSTILTIPEIYRNVDDVWISAWLERSRGIPRIVIGNPYCRPTDAVPGLHDRSDFKELNRKAAIAAGFGR